MTEEQIEKMVSKIADNANIPNGLEMKNICKDFAKICVKQALTEVNKLALGDVSGSEFKKAISNSNVCMGCKHEITFDCMNDCKAPDGFHYR